MNTIDLIEVMRLRSSAIRIAGGKLINALARLESDDRLRDLLVYYAAHTGRFGSRAVQIHNLPKGASEFDCAGFLGGAVTWERLEEYRAKAEAKRGSYVYVDDCIAALIRSCFVPSPGMVLGIVDYNAIELRCIAWLAEQENLLNNFRTGYDTYKEMASRLFKKDAADVTKDERWIGKQIVLGCGYGMGHVKFDLMCKGFGVDLASKGVSAQQCVDLFRTAYPAIAGTYSGVKNGVNFRRGGLWHDYSQAMWKMIGSQREDGSWRIKQEDEVTVRKCTFRREGNDVLIYLPSGRPIVYRDVRMEKTIPKWAKAIEVNSVVFTHPRGYRSILFGGKITENISQAVCRDLLCHALKELDDGGFNPVLHVHDEIVCEFPGDHTQEMWLSAQADIMVDPPMWAKGFPIGVEGFTAPRYSKSPWPGYCEVKR